AFENGFNVSSASGFQNADDIKVDAETLFTATGLTANIFVTPGFTVTNLDDVFYEEDEDAPGAILETITGMTSETQEIIGSNFGFDIREVVMTFPEAYEFPVSGAEEHYFMELVVTDSGVNGAIFWEVTTLGELGHPIHTNDNGTGWVADPDGADAVFTIEGTCVEAASVGEDELSGFAF